MGLRRGMQLYTNNKHTRTGWIVKIHSKWNFRMRCTICQGLCAYDNVNKYLLPFLHLLMDYCFIPAPKTYSADMFHYNKKGILQLIA